MDPELQRVVDLLFTRRLESFQRAVASRESTPTTLTKTAKLTECAEAFQTHCTQTLRAYITLLELFDALTTPDGVVSAFEAHVDTSAAELTNALEATSQADRNRITNQAASVKATTAAELAEEIERARRAATEPKTEADELDDRLPLGRRGALDRDLRRAVQQAERDRSTFALVMVDIDHFKKVNDVHGHAVGDEVLLEVAKLLVNRAHGKGAAYRFGGEEFSILLPSYSTEEAVGLAERIRKDLEEATVSSKALNVTASFGVASVPADATRAEELFEKADAALYEAKRSGRNRVATP